MLMRGGPTVSPDESHWKQQSTDSHRLVPPTSQVSERDEIEGRIVKMLDELFHDDCAGGCDCEECDPEEEGHEDDCDCGGCGPSGSWAFRRGEHVAQLRAARAAGITRWRDAASRMRA